MVLGVSQATILDGGDNRDVLTGGGGSDVFKFGESFAMRDTVTDFSNALDVLVLNVASATNELITVTDDGADTLIVFGGTDVEIALARRCAGSSNS